MSAFKNPVRTLILGGILFLFPIVILIAVILKALHLVGPVVRKIADFLGIDTIFGTATIGLLGILFILIICFISGYLIHLGLLKKWNSTFEDAVYTLFPSLRRLKFRFFSEEDDSGDNWISILLKRDKSFHIAFITFKSENGILSIFIPDAPEISNGEVILVPEAECIYKHIPRQEAMKLLVSFGKGLSVKEYQELEKM
ncbi:putative membrane protein [Christiangramia gaetbulicola]|uniref:Putative membrane protein n=1 Tax=Christiangramia gaetbulicola TaxID=703340 RepID=A0A2T6AHG8_9FLAO|nr:hypothetical protein [Christiangramia gaetbulicola]PTX43264.1 putative membrane protein [Christiangramia gaetbulicola]